MEDSKDSLFQKEMEILGTRIMLNKLISLNLQLFNEIRKYAYENSVPLTFSPSILRLVDEIQKTDVECFPTKVTTNPKSDDKLPEPVRKHLNSSKTMIHHGYQSDLNIFVLLKHEVEKRNLFQETWGLVCVLEVLC